MASTTWHTLPTEMKLAVVDNLDVVDARAFSAVDQSTYAACVPVLFRVCLYRRRSFALLIRVFWTGC
jgi:hypothetical protein